MNQYPVFPWILSDYKNPLNLNDKKIFRNFSYTVCTQNDSKRKEIIDKYDNDYESKKKFQVHFSNKYLKSGCHYSSSAIVLGYLLRLQPFTNNSIKLQSNKFDNANRIFVNLDQTYSFLAKNHDNREITPEFYYCPEFLVNKLIYQLN